MFPDMRLNCRRTLTAAPGGSRLPDLSGPGASRSALYRKTAVFKHAADVVFRHERAVLDTDRTGFRRHVDAVYPREVLDDVDDGGRTVGTFDT